MDKNLPELTTRAIQGNMPQGIDVMSHAKQPQQKGRRLEIRQWQVGPWPRYGVLETTNQQLGSEGQQQTGTIP